MKKGLLVIALLIASMGLVKAQYATATVNGTIAANEYGTHTDGSNQNTNSSVVSYMTWDATNLYVAVSGSNIGEAIVLYLDKAPQIPVNGGTNANGTLVGNSYDGTNFANLPFRADLVIYAKNGYREYRTADGSNGWSTATTNFGSYTDNGSNVQEFSIPWSVIGGIPSAFNYFMYKTSSGGSVYSQQPTANASGSIGTTARYERYFTVSTTANSTATKPFAQESVCTNQTGASTFSGTGPYFDFTVNQGFVVSLGSSFTANNAIYIESSSTLSMPSSGGVRTITLGSASTNTPSLTCNGTLTPNNGVGNDLNITAAFGTTTISGSAANTAFKIFNLTVNAGATVQAPSSGIVDLGWQFGTITVASTGILNFVNGSGVVNVTNSGTTSACQIANSGTMTFNNLTNASGNTLRPANSPATSAINVKGNLVNNGTSFVTTYTSGTTGTLNITMNGTSAQALAAATYQNLAISNSSFSVTAAGASTISGNLTITSSCTFNDGGFIITVNGNILGGGIHVSGTTVSFPLTTVLTTAAATTSSGLTIPTGLVTYASTLPAAITVSSYSGTTVTFSTGTGISAGTSYTAIIPVGELRLPNTSSITAASLGNVNLTGATTVTLQNAMTIKNIIFSSGATLADANASCNVTLGENILQNNASAAYTGSSKIIPSGTTGIITGSAGPLLVTNFEIANGVSFTFAGARGVTVTNNLNYSGTSGKIIFSNATTSILTIGNATAATVTNMSTTNVIGALAANNGTLVINSSISSVGTVYFDPSNFGVTNRFSALTLTAGGVTFGNSFNTNNAVALTAGTVTLATNVTWGVYGNFTRTGGVVDASSSGCRVSYLQNALTIPSGIFSPTNVSNISVSTTNNITLSTAITITNNLTLSSTGTFIITTAGNLTMANGSNITRSNTCNITTNPPVYGTASTDRVNINITGTCTSGLEILGTTGGIGTLTISSAAVYTYNPTSNATINTGLTISSTGVGALTISAAKTVIMANGSTITRSGIGTIVNSGNGFQYGLVSGSGGASTDRVNIAISATVTSVAELSGTSGVAGAGIGTLTISGSAVYTLAQSPTIYTGLTISSSGIGALTINASQNVIMANGSTITRSGTGTIVNSGNGFQYGLVSGSGGALTDRVNIAISATVTSVAELSGTSGVAGAGIGTLTISGSAVYTLAQSPTIYTGLTISSSGTGALTINASQNVIMANGSTITRSGTGTIVNSGNGFQYGLVSGSGGASTDRVNITISATVNSSAELTGTSGVVGAGIGTLTISSGTYSLATALTTTVNALVVGTGVAAILQYASYSSGAVTTLNVSTTVTIGDGATFQCGIQGATVNHVLNVGGNISIGNGSTFNMTSSSSTTLRYIVLTLNSTSASNQTISSTGTPTLVTFGIIILNRGNSAYKVVCSVTASTTPSGQIITYTNGIWEQSAGTLTINASTQTIPSTGGLIISGSGSFSQGGSTTVNGIFTLNTSGIYTMGNGSSSIFTITASTANATLTAGTLNINGRLNIGSSALLTINGATVNIPTGGTVSTASNSIIQVTNTTTFNFSSGAINVKSNNANQTLADIQISSNNGSISGGTITVSDVAISVNIATPVYNFIIDNGGGTATAMLVTTALVVSNNLTINSGTLDAATNSLNVTVGGNWVNNGTYSPGSNTTTFNGTGTQTITKSGGESFNNLTISNTSNTVTAGSAITVSSTLTTNASTTLDMGINALSVATVSHSGTLKTQNTSGNPITASKTWGGTVEYNGTGAQTLVTGNYNNLTISGTRTGSPSITLGSGTIGVGGTFSVTATGIGSYTNTGNTIDFTSASSQTIPAFNYNNLSNSGNGNRTLAGSGTIGIAGTYTPTSGTRTITGSTIDFNGTGAQTINASTYNNLSISGTRTGSPAITLGSGTIGVGGTFSVTATGIGSYINTNNTFNFTSASSQTIPAFNYNNLSSSGNGARTLASSGTIGIAGTYTPTSGTRTITGSTIDFNGTGSQTVNATTYHNLSISGSGTKTLVGNTVLGGGLTVSSILDASTYTITPAASTVTISGTFKTTNTNGFSGSASTAISSVNSPSYTLTGSTIEYMAGTAQTVSSRSDYNNLTISGGSTKTMAATVTVGGALKLSSSSDKLSIGADTLKLNGTVDAASVGFITGGTSSNLTIGSTTTVGTLLFDQTSATTSTLKNITLNGSGGTTTLGNALNLTGILTPTSGTLASGGYLTLKSTSITNSAIVAQGNGTVTGDVTAERFIPTSSNGVAQGRRAFRDLSPGVITTQSVYQAWQESGSNSNGYGTQITGVKGTPGQTDVTTGLDYTISGSKSMYSYNINTATGAATWDAITDTKNTIPSPFKGYRLLVRGDRANNLGADASLLTSAATLRPKGQLISGTVLYRGDTVTANGVTYTAKTNNLTSNVAMGHDVADAFTMIGNPYISPIDWVSIANNNSAAVKPSIYIWDPNIGTTGAYVTYNSSTGSSNGGSQVNQYIQPGQAFFIQRNGSATPQFQIRDVDKSPSQSNLTNVFGEGNTMPLSKIRFTLLKTISGSQVNMDGAVMCYRPDFSNEIGREDAQKIDNSSECLAINSHAKLYSIEGRATAAASDSIGLKLYYTTNNANYQLNVDLTGFTSNGSLQPYLKDRFTKTITPLTLGTQNMYGFVTTTDTSSYNNRFTVVFGGNTVLPIGFTSVKAYSNTNTNSTSPSNTIEWTANEAAADYYEVEHSSNVQVFASIGRQTASGNGLNSYSYSHQYGIAGNNYYRIKGMDKSGRISYSATVLVNNSNSGNRAASVSVYPNPIANGVANVHFSNMVAGSYAVTIHNIAGQTVYQGSMAHNGQATASYALGLPNKLAQGVYSLTVGNGSSQFKQQLIVK